MRTSVGRPRWMSPSTPSTACWSSDARATSAPPDPRRGWGQCARTPDPCTTLTYDPGRPALVFAAGDPHGPDAAGRVPPRPAPDRSPGRLDPPPARARPGRARPHHAQPPGRDAGGAAVTLG